MIEKLKNSFKNHWDLYILLIIVIISVFFHFWNFRSNLLFRADQARDAFYAKEVFDNGLGALRLLGPKINIAYIEGDLNPRGETLNIGPFYFYLQTFFVFLFQNNDPWVLAFPDALFFVFSIPLFFYLCIQFFSKENSLLITSLYGFSFFNLLYSSFNWNPNQLFFWEILLILSLVKLFQTDNENKGRWFVLLVLSFLIISQLHFVAFVGFSLLLLPFLFFISFSKISVKYWIISFFLVFVFNLPMVVSEIKNNGDNFKRLFVSMTKKPKEDKVFSKKISKTYNKIGEFVAFGITSFNEKEISLIEKMGGLFFICSVIFVVFLIIFNKKFILFKKQKIFSFLILIWAVSFFLVFLKIYEKLDNVRYFITISPLVFLFIGIWISLLEKNRQFYKFGITFSFFIIVILIFFNIQASVAWQKALQGNYSEKLVFNRDLKLEPYEELIAFGEMEKTFDYMVAEANRQNKKICFRSANYQYNLAFEFIQKLNYPQVVFGGFSPSDKYSDCVYFVLGRTKKGEKDLKKELSANFKIKNSKLFGAIKLWELELKEELWQYAEEKKEEEKKGEILYRAEKWEHLFNKPPYIN